ncbi:M18 family aminopeptidase [Schaalia suimastitidis]|uniref:M18 family aminopeptidase n=1 Tax=Schaalia suimastitidis TaxID=121163 RepID=UPI0006844FB1|nr:M18 family aminopeptidase [Schaalia suimastitidis]
MSSRCRTHQQHGHHEHHILDYLQFLNDCPSSYHAAHLVAQRLVDAGFERQVESEPWSATPGGHVMVRDGATIAWVVPEYLAPTAGFRIVGAHTDSPTFVVKPHPTTRTTHGWEQINVEVYGGMLWNSWLDRELAIAGRLITDDGTEVLVRTGALARIPQLAIHLDRTVNADGLKLDPQRHLHPVWNVGTPADLMARVARDAGLHSAEQIVASDLNLIPTQGAAVFGADNQFIASGRQDNLSSVHAGLRALERLYDLGVPDSGDIVVFACFDHEEIGSDSRSGAAGPLLSDVLTRTATALGRNADGLGQMLAASWCVSADAAHSVHPNYVEHHDPDHFPVLGGGVVVKVNANQRYATDAVGQAMWRATCGAAEVPTQVFVSNNAMPCGSTIGPITATRLGIRTIDVGAGMLSMHSAREMTHVDDVVALSTALEGFWRSL